VTKQEEKLLAIGLILIAVGAVAVVYLFYPESIPEIELPFCSWQEVSGTPEMMAIYALSGLVVILAVVPKKKVERSSGKSSKKSSRKKSGKKKG